MASRSIIAVCDFPVLIDEAMIAGQDKLLCISRGQFSHKIESCSSARSVASKTASSVFDASPVASITL